MSENEEWGVRSGPSPLSNFTILNMADEMKSSSMKDYGRAS